VKDGGGTGRRREGARAAGHSSSRKEGERRATGAGSIPGWCQRGVAARRLRRGPIDSRRTRSRGSRSLARGLRLRYASGAAEPSMRHELRLEQRRATPDQWIGRSKRRRGSNPRRATARRPHPGQGVCRRRERASGGSKASKRACRPRKRRARCKREVGRVPLRGCGLAAAGISRHGPSSRFVRGQGPTRG